MPGKPKRPGGHGYGGSSKKCIGRKMKSKKTNQNIPHAEDTLANLFANLSAATLPKGWIVHKFNEDEIQCIKLQQQWLGTPVIIFYLLIIRSDLTWELHTANHLISSECSVLCQQPSHLATESARRLIRVIDNSNYCIGNTDERFIELARKRKGKFLTSGGKVIASLEEGICIYASGEKRCSTIRHTGCKILLSTSVVCPVCTNYRSTLRVLLYRQQKSQPLCLHPNMNTRFFTTPQRRAHMQSLRKAIRNKNRQLKRLKLRLEKIVENDSVEVDEELSQDLQMIVEDPSNAASVKDEFKRIFWDQQVAACKAKRNGIRWHPLFIRWCLNIMLTSSKTYDIIRESGFISLPSRRTLRDYTNWVKLRPGFNAEVIDFIRKEFKVETLPPWKRYVTVAFDEMKIREDIVFNKTTGEIVGFVDYGEENFDERFQELRTRCNKDSQINDRIVATHMLLLMVRGIFFKMDVPIAQFPTTGVSADDLVYIIWKAIRLLSLAELNVICVVADGASANRKFFASHAIEEHKKSNITFKAPNITLPGNFVYFICDVPHLMKTTRNAWSNSRAKGTCHLENNGKEIKWAHIVELAEKSQSHSGLYIGNKLKREHIYLTSYSRMNVRLAAQVLSSSVAVAFKTLRTQGIMQDTEETEQFCRLFDRFFDMLNTRAIDEGIRRRKPDLKAYEKVDDSRFQWLEQTFLKYIDDWERYVKSKEAIPKAAKQFCMLPPQTIRGLKICVFSFCDMAKFLLSQPGVGYILSERFNQDPVECFFGQQRSRGQRNDNPSVQQFMQNTQAIIMQKSLATGSSSSITKKRTNLELSPLCRPLAKRRCIRKII